MIQDYFSLASRNIRKKGLRSWLTILGVFIGIVAVVSLITLGAGLKFAILGQLQSLSADVLTIQNKETGFGPPGSTVVKKLTERDLKVVEDVRGVKNAIPSLLRVIKLEYNKIGLFTMIRSVPEDADQREEFYKAQSLEAEQGRLLKQGDLGKIVIGNNFLDEDKFEKPLVPGKKIKINGEAVEIVGILKKSSLPFANDVVLMFHEEIKETLEIGDEIDLIGAKIEEGEEISEVSQRLEDKLRKDRNEKIGDETFSVESPLEIFDSINVILNIINIIVIGIAVISLIVGAVGIANTMYTSVLERTKDIGVMKAIGARNSDILWVFLIESGLLGLVGGIAGALAGLGGAIVISNIANSALGTDLFIVVVSYPLLIGAVGFSFLVGIISGVLPALQASKLNVVDALRS